ncbi:MAG: Cell division protein FtsL [Eubacteriales bacterium SKADARSKE-1]|nr:Cell division protein FtsL [Eubacteriales bacterium SKADARSKE-1]
MSLKEKNVAYDLSLFEEVTINQQDNVLELPNKGSKTNKKRKTNPFFVLAVSIFSFICLGIVGTVVYNQVQLTELTANINSVTKKLNESEGVYTQLQVKTESNLSLSIVEDYAKNELKMSKIDPAQIEYISLSKGDKATIKNDKW